jgi:hypothetical protein
LLDDPLIPARLSLLLLLHQARKPVDDDLLTLKRLPHGAQLLDKQRQARRQLVRRHHHRWLGSVNNLINNLGNNRILWRQDHPPVAAIIPVRVQLARINPL